MNGYGSRCRFACGAPTLERKSLVIRLCTFDTIKFKGGFQICDLYTPLTQLNLRAAFKYVICILQGLHSYFKLVIQEAQKVLNY